MVMPGCVFLENRKNDALAVRPERTAAGIDEWMHSARVMLRGSLKLEYVRALRDRAQRS
jgi:hypothetical protein